MKKVFGMCMAIFVILSLLLPCQAAGELSEAFYDEDVIWDWLSEYSPSDAVTAGVMGFFYRESRMKPDSVAGWPARDLGLDESICESFTREIDEGLADGSTREKFIEMVNIHFGGYGLGQWSNVTYLEHFYDFMSERGGSIGDPKLQCEFIFESMKQNKRLWTELLDCKTAMQCGRRIGYLYDGTGFEGSETIASIAQIYYGRYTD